MLDRNENQPMFACSCHLTNDIFLGTVKKNFSINFAAKNPIICHSKAEYAPKDVPKYAGQKTAKKKRLYKNYWQTC